MTTPDDVGEAQRNALAAALMWVVRVSAVTHLAAGALLWSLAGDTVSHLVAVAALVIGFGLYMLPIGSTWQHREPRDQP